jgi:DNA-binding NtrC family response regulator
LESGFWQVLFLDRRLPDLDAEELSQTVRRRFPAIEVVLLDQESSADPTSSANEKRLEGTWPTAGCAANEIGTDGSPRPRSGFDGPGGGPASILDEEGECSSDCILPPAIGESLPGMIGNSLVMQPVYRLVRLLAPRNTSVLVTGPTGSGKEIVARALHLLGPRATRGFAVVNCAAIPESLLEAELFGYARGAFTGAMQSYAGRIQAAQGGTLFLDEIGEMPLSLQPKLLRFLEQKELQRLGSAEVVRVDARVVSATNAHLLSLVREGKFREDLYYRLCGFPIDIPALRERRDDIASLTAHFLAKYAAPLPAPRLSSHALQLLRMQPWAGNIRELQNVIERALIMVEDQPVILPEHLMLAEPVCPASRP